MASSANTFGTYLATINKLRSSRSGDTGTPGEERASREVIQLGDMISRAGGQIPVKDALNMFGLDREHFLLIVEEALKRNLVTQTERDGSAILELSSLGKALAET